MPRKHTQQTIKKIRESNLGKKRSSETRNKISKAKKGKPLTEEHKKKISEGCKGRKVLETHKPKCKCLYCRISRGELKNRKVTNSTKKKISLAKKGKTLKELGHKKNCPCCVCKAKRGEFKGKNNPSFVHGQSSLPYPLEFNQYLKNKIRERDNYTCQNCNMSEEEHLTIIGRNLHIHHIDYNKFNSNTSNLITLCNWCNTRANYNKEYWKDFYNAQLLQRI